jgi:hypothetical protein
MYHVCAENSTIALPCEKYNETKYIIHYLASKFTKTPINQRRTRGVSCWGLAIYIKKYLKAKEELWKLKYFTMQIYNLQNNPLKETKILQDIISL